MFIFLNCFSIELVDFSKSGSLAEELLSSFLRFFFGRSPSKHQENLTRSEEMAALVLTALSISPVLKDQENCKLKFW